MMRFAQVIFRTCKEERGRVVFQMGTGDAGVCVCSLLLPLPAVSLMYSALGSCWT
jgi:hypothetical protein